MDDNQANLIGLTLAFIGVSVLLCGCDTTVPESSTVRQEPVAIEKQEPPMIEVQLPKGLTLPDSIVWLAERKSAGDLVDTRLIFGWTATALEETRVVLGTIKLPPLVKLEVEPLDSKRVDSDIRQLAAAAGAGAIVIVYQDTVYPCPPCTPNQAAIPGCSCPEDEAPKAVGTVSKTLNSDLDAVRDAVAKKLGDGATVTRLDTPEIPAKKLARAPYFLATTPSTKGPPRPPRQEVFVYDTKTGDVFHREPDLVSRILTDLGLASDPDRLSAKAWLTLAEGISQGRLISVWSTGKADTEHHAPRLERTGQRVSIIGWYPPAPPSPAMERVSLTVEAGKVRYERGPVK